MNKQQSTLVFSYLRFSTPEQSLGDSERRQIAATREWAQRNGYTLDESLCMADRGLSGYHGAHRKRGVLGQFLQRVRQGQVPAGSILVVENLDRLSREGVETTLRKVIFELWDDGVVLQTLTPEETYPPGCSNEPRFLALWMYLARAREESQRKSERVRAARNHARQRARDDKRVLTARCPAWLSVDPDRRYQLDPQAAQAIRVIFDLYIEGVGVGTIAKTLNDKNGWMPPKAKAWRRSYVKKILANPAVVGDYQPYSTKDGQRAPVGEPISEYYPAVIFRETFQAAQARLAGNRGRGGRTGRCNNLFQHIVKCPYCGGSMVFVDKGRSSKGGRYLVCDKGHRGISCSSKHRIRYDEVEQLVLENCRGLRPEEILPSPDEQARLCSQLRKSLKGYIATLHDIERRIGNLVNSISDADTPSLQHRLKEQIITLEQQADEVRSDQDAAQQELRTAESASRSFAQWRQDLATLRKASQSIDVRQRLQAHLREIIDRVEVYAIGFGELYDHTKDNGYRSGRIVNRGGSRHILRRPGYRDCTETIEADMYELVGEVYPEMVRSKAFAQFVNELVRRRMSKEGRFVRVHFKTGAWVDLVPQESLATGRALIKRRWESVGPNFAKLWTDYAAKMGS